MSGFSPFHFLRIFSAFTGETPNAFIKRIRAEKAAMMLLNNPKMSVTRIAFSCGYSSSQAFSRDFRNIFHSAPSAYRENDQSNIRHISRKRRNAAISPLLYDTGKGRAIKKNLKMSDMEVNIRELPAMTVAYIRHIGNFKQEPSLFSIAFEKLCGWAFPRGFVGRDTLFLSAYYDDPKITAEDKMRVDICLTIPEGALPAGEIGKTVLPGGKYAVARIEAGNTADFEEGWNRLYREWLPQSGYEPDNKPCLEIYRNDPKKDKSGRYITDICVPLK